MSKTNPGFAAISHQPSAISQAGIIPPEWTKTRTFSDPAMTTKGF